MAHAYLMGLIERECRNKLLQMRRSEVRQHVAWNMPEQEFIDNYSVSISLFQEIVDELKQLSMPPRQKSRGIPIELKIMAALDFYASGSYQRVGKDLNLGLDLTVAVVTHTLNEPEILQRHIKFPANGKERLAIMRGFNDVFGCPGVVGCVDETHISIIRPHLQEEAFFNRKHYHSINAMIICDVNMNILHVDASYGGACHDSHMEQKLT